MAQNHQPAPRCAAARCPQNPVSGRENCPALPSGCTLRNVGRSYATVRCHAANSGTDAEYAKSYAVKVEADLNAAPPLARCRAALTLEVERSPSRGSGLDPARCQDEKSVG